jgi:hypothetical protein
MVQCDPNLSRIVQDLTGTLPHLPVGHHHRNTVNHWGATPSMPPSPSSARWSKWACQASAQCLVGALRGDLRLVRALPCRRQPRHGMVPRVLSLPRVARSTPWPRGRRVAPCAGPVAWPSGPRLAAQAGPPRWFWPIA